MVLWSPDCTTCPAGRTSFQYMTCLSSSLFLSLDLSLLLILFSSTLGQLLVQFLTPWFLLSGPFSLPCVLSQAGAKLAVHLRMPLTSRFACTPSCILFMTCSTGGGQRTTCEHWLSPSIMCVPEVELRASDSNKCPYLLGHPISPRSYFLRTW